MVAGFAHAPLTKGILIIVSIASVLVSLFQLKPFIHLQIHPHLTLHHQWYRLFSQHFAFTNSSELFLALLLLYNAGVKVERTFGTYKFASFLAVITALYTLAQVVLLGLASLLLTRYTAPSETRNGVEREAQKHWLINGASPAGPWGPLFAIIHQHQSIIPHLWSISLAPPDLQLTDQHIQIHSLSLLLAFSQTTSTLFASTLGILISSVYRSHIPPFSKLKHYRLPLRLYRIAALLFTPWIGETRPPQRSWRAEAPMRRTLQAREARLAEHNAAVANLNRTSSGLPRIASLLRRRESAGQSPGQGPGQGQGQTQGSGQGLPGRVQQRLSTIGERSEGAGWNDVPPNLGAIGRAGPRRDGESLGNLPGT
ncbi:uncharacterized protein UTRI_05237 [Ustilago trichophora]|uniref:Peptidase S54 rhomboid domain-containing protein n=1 Tax=Ustilago trichophora TaxID=86804 RepID=A0A5C3EKL6_9BASI|nr:uncharacterized protein UTRI_05237 [Ustilago trichophora]